MVDGPTEIRAWTEADIDARSELLRDPDIQEYVSDPPTSLEKARSQLANEIECTVTGTAYRLAVSLVGVGEVIGFCGLGAIRPSDDRQEVVVAIASHHRNAGHGGRATRLLVTAAFLANPALNAIFARVGWRNWRSKRLVSHMRMEKAEAYPNSRGFCPDRLYAVDRTAWSLMNRNP